MSSKDGKESDFFNRWSDRKTAERDDQSQEKVEIPEQAAVALPSGQEETSDENLPVPDDLPDIKTLDKNSDFFTNWINQAKIYLNFTNEIARVI